MSPVSASRIVIAILVIAAVAIIAQFADAAISASLAAAIAGGAALLIVTLGRSSGTNVIAPRPDPESDLAIETRLLAAIGEPVLFAIDGRVRIANDAAQALLGSHIVGEDVRLAVRHPAAAEQLAPTAPDGSVELVGLGGRDQRVQMRVETIRPGQRLIHLIDRTTSYAAERARVDFVANASHELRTPLAAILGFIETLDDDNAGNDDAVRHRFLEIMNKEARRMQRLIDDLISLSRIEAEKYQLPDTEVALPALIAEVAGEIRDDNNARRTDLILAVNADVSPVTADRAQLSQVIHNLVSNAFKYGRSDAPVTVALGQEGDLIRLSVADQGDGIAPEHLPRLTERFYRVDPGRSRNQGGTGLGLSIVKHIVERHRGRLDIASTLGVGTTVSMLLPAATKGAVTQTSSN